MPTKMSKVATDQVLTRILDAFAQELVDASDEEILEAAKDLGMDPRMKGSAAFVGVMHPSPRELSDFFDVDELKGLLGKRLLGMAYRNRTVGQLPEKPRDRSRRSGRPRLSSEKKPPNGK